MTKKEESFSMEKVIDVNEAHEIFGHIHEQALKDTAIMMGFKLVVKMKVCEGCALAKAKAKPVKKYTDNKSSKPGERIYIDTSGPFKKSLGGNTYWAKIVDEYSRFSTSKFVKLKDEVGDVVIKHIEKMNSDGKTVKNVRMDNAGENVSKITDYFERKNVKEERTSPNTPQYNAVVERIFVTDRERATAMLFATDLEDGLRSKLWAEAVATSEKLGNWTTNTIDKMKSPYEKYKNSKPKMPSRLIQFGRIGLVTIRAKIRGKWIPKSKKCIFVGYSEDKHPNDVYRMFDPDTYKIRLSRDIKWADWESKNASVDERIQSEVQEDKTVESESDDEESNDDLSIATEDSNENEKSKKLEKVNKLIESLRTSYNDLSMTKTIDEGEMNRRSNDSNQGMNLRSNCVIENHFIYNVSVISDPETPKNFQQEMKSPEKNKWKQSMKDEINNFIK